MKNNQFANYTPTFWTQIKELKAMKFYIDAETNLTFLLEQSLDKIFLDYQTAGSKHQKYHSLLATESTSVDDFFKMKKELTPAIFYNIALQLLEFEVGIDFKIDDPFTAMTKIQLPSIEIINSVDDFWSAWYLLLTTHTKNGQVFTDLLANKGYFVSFYEDAKPLFFNGKAQPVFDTTKLIREVVYVEAPLDTDHDGQRDLLKTEILRPTVTSGFKVPVLYTASPYNQGTNDEAEVMHNVDIPLAEKPVTDLSEADITYTYQEPELPNPRPVLSETTETEQTFSREFPYTLNDYMLARGFAVVYAAGIGTRESDGVRTCGSVEETVSTVAIIEWLTGQRQAFTNKLDNRVIKATWSNGNVAMTGKSYLGTLATAAATTGISGLKTIISEAAISSWYDYYRENGLVVAPAACQGEDADVLAELCLSRKKDAADYTTIQNYFGEVMDKLATGQNRESGNYNQFWDERNYLNQVQNIKANIIMVHGLNDWNVKPRQVEQLWQALRPSPVVKKLFLHQGKHIYINNFHSLDFTDMMNLWLSNQLYDVENGAETLIPNVTMQDNLDAETWHTFDDWADPDSPVQSYHFQQDKLTQSVTSDEHQSVTFKDDLPDDIFNAYVTNNNLWEHDLISTKETNMAENRVQLVTDSFTERLFLSGSAHVKLSVSAGQTKGLISCMLIDYGEANRLNEVPTVLGRKALDTGFHWREDDLVEFTKSATFTPWKMISKGHINLQNRTNRYQNDSVLPGTFNTVEFDLQPTAYQVEKGHQLGLVIYATDFGMTLRNNDSDIYTINLANSRLKVPYQPNL
ncbi:Xaa-Pro dipeptidyl-peptidase [Dellaglioa algida]|nr:Xaa-Pro dipeptidyl-peptidase [Dellaglioa algida]